MQLAPRIIPLSVQEQDPSNVKGLPGNKSGPPAKR